MYLGSSDNHRRLRRHHHRVAKDEGHDHHPHPPAVALDPHHDASLDFYQPESAGSLRRQVAASLTRHHQSSERNKHALQPLSPASYGSSLEMAPYNPDATPRSSIELRGRIGESNYNFKTSTELLKVLNRIWTLEEQHTSNVSLVKALKNELDNAHCKIKELLRDQHSNRHEINELMKKISEGRKSKDQERNEAVVLSVREELENERKLRKRSESLHRKLARELFEVKVSLSNTVKDLEKERKSNVIMEELFDEFAKGIREYARQVHSIRQKSDKDWTDTRNHENLLLHISESWLDQKMQFRNTEKSSIVDKLRPEIEAFLAAKKPAIVGPTKTLHQEELAFSVRTKNHHIHSPCTSVQISDPQNTPQEIDDGNSKTGEKTINEMNMLQKSEIYDALMKDGARQRTRGYYYEGRGGNNNLKTVDKLVSELLVSEGGNLPPEYEYKEASAGIHTVRRNASPANLWMSNMKSPDPRISDSSKLHEPRMKEPKPRSKLKFLKGYS